MGKVSKCFGCETTDSPAEPLQRGNYPVDDDSEKEAEEDDVEY